MIPIIDAGVKVEDGYSIYEEGVEKQYFCKREDGSDFVAAVWPGRYTFPRCIECRCKKMVWRPVSFFDRAGIEGFGMI